MLIREAKRKDADEIARLGKLWHDNIDIINIKNIFLELLEFSDRHFIFVAELEEEKKLVGFCHWAILRHLAFGFKIGQLEAIFVTEEYRKKGIGKSLMLAGMKSTRMAGAYEFRINDVILSNLPAIIMYEKLGFDSMTLILGKHNTDIVRDENTFGHS